MNLRYRVTWSEAEQAALRTLLAGGTAAVGKVKRASRYSWPLIGVSPTRRLPPPLGSGSLRCRVRGSASSKAIWSALTDVPRLGARQKLSSKEEALLVATTCATPPAGRARWTLTLLAGTMVQLTAHETLSRETVRRRLAENALKPWRQGMWCIPCVDTEYVARMEDVLGLYAEAPDPARPVVYFDETPMQLIGEVRQPVSAAPGRPALVDYEYQRNGAANFFVFVDVHRSWRTVKVTDRRTAQDFAACMRDLVDVNYPRGAYSRGVRQRLHPFGRGTLHHGCPGRSAADPAAYGVPLRPQTCQLVDVVEIEISVLRTSIAAWEQQRNASGARIRWLFTPERAREKTGRTYRAPAMPLPAAA